MSEQSGKMAEIKTENEGASSTSPLAEQEVASEVEPKPEEIVTPEMLSGILADYNKRNNSQLELVDFDAKQGTIAGDNYMSIIYAVKMNLKNAESGEVDKLEVMLKVLPRNEFRVKHINDANIFKRDVFMYDKIIPEMEKFQRDVGVSERDICAPWPKCFSSKTDGKGDYLAMEDLKAQGYKMANRQVGLDFEHCKLVLQTMAKFHAVSYAMYLGNFDKILEIYPLLKEDMFNEEKIPQVWKDMIYQTYKQQAEKVREAGEELGAMLLEKIPSDTYFNDLYQLVGAKVKWAVIGHGDCWTNNILFRYDEETNKPIEVKFVDYQVTRVASRAVDIHYFLYSSPQMQVLNEREDELKQIYFEEFIKFAKRLGVDINGQELTKENFEEEIDLIRFYGVVSGFMLALVTSADSSDVPEIDNISQEDMENPETSKNFFLGMMKGNAIQKLCNLTGTHLPKCRQMQKHLEN